MTPAFTHDQTGTAAAAWRASLRTAIAEGSAQDLDLTDLDGRPVRRIVVLAAHPDDETLGAAGLMATAHARGVSVELIVFTDGEGSHPHSPTHSARQLAARRREESRQALERVAPGARHRRLGLRDGALAAAEEELVVKLVALVGEGRGTLLVAPWRHDGHTDHEAAGRVAAATARRTGARLLEYPVWALHWGRPQDAPWTDVRRLRLSPDAVAAKAAALAEHVSQVAPLSDLPGDERLLGEGFLAHFLGADEAFLEQPAADLALDRLHAAHADPWGVDRRWYEQRKRDLVLAALPVRHVGRALEVGCSTGALSEALADRCTELVALDASPVALAAARTRLADRPGVHVQAALVPEDWPAAAFDLVVLSEVGYFLSPRDLDRLVQRVRDALSPGGIVVLCHWRHPVVGYLLDGAAVHARFRSLLGRPEVAAYADRDVEIIVLTDPDRLPEPHA